MTPWLDDGDVRLFHGDALDVLREMPTGTVHMCATSPPFWNLRDYNAPGQIGLEATPEEWTASLVAVFREVRRVLRDDGTLWIECGDMYASSPPGNVRGVGETSGLAGANSDKYRATLMAGHATKRDTSKLPNVKPKDLIGAPWLLAFALRADGWYLRSEIIWARPNPMPESVTDRPTKAHSTVFLLSKRPRYFWDADAIREPAQNWGGGRRDVKSPNGGFGVKSMGGRFDPIDGKANARSVWQIPTEPTPFAHFATWPQALVRRMILAGTSERGACPECGAPWVRETERELGERTGGSGGEGKADAARPHGTQPYFDNWVPRRLNVTTLGWSPSCACYDVERERLGLVDVDGYRVAVPCTVLDPFAGSGTTCLVARNHGRHSVGIELNQSYLEIAAQRLSQLSLLSEPYQAGTEDPATLKRGAEQSALQP